VESTESRKNRQHINPSRASCNVKYYIGPHNVATTPDVVAFTYGIMTMACQADPAQIISQASSTNSISMSEAGSRGYRLPHIIITSLGHPYDLIHMLTNCHKLPIRGPFICATVPTFSVILIFCSKIKNEMTKSSMTPSASRWRFIVPGCPGVD